jgi:hypothetical protein
MPVYAEHLRNVIKEGVNRKDDVDMPLRGFHICVDAGNGGGGYFATSVLAPLGADISGAGVVHPPAERPVAHLVLAEMSILTFACGKYSWISCAS